MTKPCRATSRNRFPLGNVDRRGDRVCLSLHHFGDFHARRFPSIALGRCLTVVSCYRPASVEFAADEVFRVLVRRKLIQIKRILVEQCLLATHLGVSTPSPIGMGDSPSGRGGSGGAGPG
jgi:hypothetical protein